MLMISALVLLPAGLLWAWQVGSGNASEHDLLRQCLLERWSHRTGRRARKTRAPLYRLRWALSHLWQRYPPACISRSRQPGHPPWLDRLPAWLLWVLVFLNLCPKSSG